MGEIERIVEANRRYAETLHRSDVAARPARRVAVLTCMDPRLVPLRSLGLEAGDAHVIRNAGGRASDDAIRSLVVSSTLLGTREFVVIQHTDCGMQTFSNEEMRRRLLEERGVDASSVDFLPIADLEASVREDVQRIIESSLVPRGVVVAGFVFDVSTGRLQEVVAPQTA
jgi:carbonic anhydrase